MADLSIDISEGAGVQERRMFDRLEALFQSQDAHWRSELIRYGLIGPAESVAHLKPSERNEIHGKLCAHLHSEVDELVRCADWKIHQKNVGADKRTIAEECVDVFKFLMNLMLTHGISHDDFYDAFTRKSLVVRRRVALERMKRQQEQGQLGPILIVDLDGVVCARDTALLEFANRYMRTHSYTHADLTAWPELGDLGYEQRLTELSQYKRLFGQGEYEHLKERFYASGGFRECIVVQAARKTLIEAHADGVPILFATSRDTKRYPHIEYDTHYWLAKNEIPHDAVVFSTEKERALTWVERTSVAVDDEQTNVDRLSYVCKSRLYFRNEPLEEAAFAVRHARGAYEYPPSI